MKDDQWGVLATAIRESAYSQGERRARVFMGLAGDTGVAVSLVERWEDLPAWFDDRIVLGFRPTPSPLRSRTQFRHLINGLRRRRVLDVPGVSGMTEDDRTMLVEVYLEGLFDGFQHRLQCMADRKEHPRGHHAER